MTVHDEPDLRAQLGSALDGLAPGPLPLPAVVRQGRAMLIRRRVTAVVAVAAVVIAAAVGGPLLARQLGQSRPAGPTYHVTVHPPGPGSRKGLIAYGRLGRARWLAAGRFTPSDGELCFWAFRYGTGGCSGSGNAPPRAVATGDPVVFASGDGMSPQVDVWRVRSDVTLVRVSLSNGQTLTLRPEAIFGTGTAEYVALAVPGARAVTEIAAYSPGGELGYAIPFTGAGSDIDIVRWLAPGQPALPAPRRYKIGSATAGGSRWSEYASIGPWGSCFDGPGFGEICDPALGGQLRGGKPAKEVASMFSGSRYGFVVVAVAPAVDHLLVHVAGRRSFQVRPQRIGGGLLACFFVDSGGNVGWTAYSAVGTKLASG